MNEDCSATGPLKTNIPCSQVDASVKCQLKTYCLDSSVEDGGRFAALLASS
jgi:hypothetical protein